VALNAPLSPHNLTIALILAIPTASANAQHHTVDDLIHHRRNADSCIINPILKLLPVDGLPSANTFFRLVTQPVESSPFLWRSLHFRNFVELLKALEHFVEVSNLGIRVIFVVEAHRLQIMFLSFAMFPFQVIQARQTRMGEK